MPSKSNGEWIPGAISTPIYPRFQDSVAQHSVEYAYGDGNKSMDKTAPSAPVLSSSSGTAKAVALSWTASHDDSRGAGLDHYELWDNGSAIYAPIPTDVLTYSHTDTAGTAHSFVVKAVDVSGNVSSSNTVAVTTV